MKRFLLGLTALFCFCFFNLPHNNEGMHRVMKFFDENGIEYIGASLEYNTSSKSKINLEGIQNKVLSQINLNPIKVSIEKDKVIEFEGAKLILSSREIGDEYILNIFYSQALRDMNIIDNIRRSLSYNGLLQNRPSFYSLMEGKMNKKLSNEEKKELIYKILKTLKGKSINLLEEERYISIVGYSIYFSNNIYVNGKIFNINIAIRDGSDGCTYILIGNPIITVEY
ncbi:MAG: YwmB family TATA-box binding protein [Caloramator sp.]|nr:YwmB family TATA-box binding protein [Caloramator sp.]